MIQQPIFRGKALNTHPLYNVWPRIVAATMSVANASDWLNV